MREDDLGGVSGPDVEVERPPTAHALVYIPAQV
jgi:hypothetical protein